MPANKKKIAKNAIALYIRMGIMLVVSLYTARVVIKELGVVDYGIYNVVGGVVSMLGFLTGALTHGVQRFFNFYIGRKDEENVNKVFWSSFVIMSAIGLLIIILGETVGLWFVNHKLTIPEDRMFAANWVYQLSLFVTICSLITVPYNAILISHEDFGVFTYISIGSAFCHLGIAFLLGIAGFDKLVFYALLMGLVSLLSLLVYVIICKNRYHSIRLARHNDKQLYKSILSFSGWNILGTSSYVVSTAGVNLIINMFFGPVVNAARGLSFQISAKVDEFINNIQQAMNPQIVQLYAQGDTEGVKALLDDNFRWNFTLYWMIALPLLFEIDYLLGLWLVEVPEYTGIFTSLIILRCLLKCFERPINSANFAVGDMKWINIYSSSTLVVSLLVMVALFYMGRPPYWAFVVDLFYVASCILFFMFKARKSGVFAFRRFLNKVLFPIILVMVISFMVTLLPRIIMESGITRLVSTLIVSTLASGISIYYILLTKSNRETLKQLVSTRILKKTV